MTTMLIIGSEGFIGKYLSSYFSNRYYSIIQCDLLPIVRPHYYNILERSSLDEIFKLYTIDICINAAGSAHVQKSFDNPMADFEANTILHFYTLHCIRKYNVDCKYINLSSAAVYGNPSTLPIAIDHVLSPISPYGYHKMISETICKEYTQLFGLKTANVRIFSAYGPGQNKLLFWDIYQKIKNKTPLEFFGTGQETRDYIFIEDIAKAIHILILHHPFDGSSINIANGEEVTISSAISTFLKAMNTGMDFSFSGNNKIGDPMYWRADIGFLTRHGYSPSYTLLQGLQKYVLWLKESGY